MMVILGLLLLAAAVVVGIEVIIANTGPLTMHLWGWTWTWDTFWLAVGGAVILLVGLIGLACIQAGAVRSRRLRRERRALADENRRLAARADRDAAAHREHLGRERAEADRAERERLERERAEREAATMHANRPATHGAPAMPAGEGTHAAPEAGYAPAQDGYAEGAHQSRFGRVLHRR